MRLPRVRFTIRRLTIAVAAMALMLGLVVGGYRMWLWLMVDFYEASKLADQVAISLILINRVSQGASRGRADFDRKRWHRAILICRRPRLEVSCTWPWPLRSQPAR